GEKLPANHYVPAHGENADDGQASGQRVDAFADRAGQTHDLSQPQQQDGGHRAEENLDDDLRHPQTRVHHEVEAAEGFVRFINALQQVEHFQAEIDHEDVEQILRNRI